MLLRFCPSCGGRLPQVAAVKYCPSCGENLTALIVPETGTSKSHSDTPNARSAVAAEVKSTTDFMNSYDQFIANLQSQGLGEAEVRRQATAMFAKLKAQLPARSNRHFLIEKVKSDNKNMHSDEHYSVVLKSIGDKERLTRRLSEVLRRGMTATRIAVEMVPCIIVYKSRLADIQAAVSIFEDERLHYTVLKGDFETNVPVEEVIPGFSRMSNELKRLLRNAPVVLWLGEKVHVVVPEVEVEGELGVLVATDRGLYIFTGPPGGQHTEWQIIPYSRLTEVILHDDGGGALEFINKRYSREAWLRIADERYLGQVYDHIRQALARQE